MTLNEKLKNITNYSTITITKTKKHEYVIYKEIKFYRYPKSKRLSERAYFKPGKNWSSKGIKRLHQEIYIDNFGEIPNDHVIHHKDGNHSNNHPTNLEAEPRSKHSRRHILEKLAEDPTFCDKAIKAARKAANKWWKSADGKALRKQVGLKLRKPKQLPSLTCVECYKTFQSYAGHKKQNLFCSKRCSAHNRHKIK